MTPLYEAVLRDEKNIVNILLEAGADVNIIFTNVSLSSNATFIDYSIHFKINCSHVFVF